MSTLRTVGPLLLTALLALGSDCGNLGLAVSITSPSSNTTFATAQTVTITAEPAAEVAHSNLVLTKMEFSQGGVRKCTDFSTPYRCAWSVTSADNGTHSWTATLFASDGTDWDSLPVDLTVEIGVATEPELVGLVPAVATAADVAVDAGRNLAFVASQEFGLSVVDVSDPLDPVAVGATLTPFEGNRIALEGSLAVLAAGTEFVVVDVSDPLDPVVVGSFDNGEVRGLSCNVKDVAISGQYGYMLVGVPGNPASVDLVVVDLRAPSSPSIRGRVAVPGNLGYAIDVLAGRAFVAANASGLQVFDVTNSSAPRWIGAVDTPGNAVSVTVEGDYAYVGEFEAVHVIDVRNPANPFRRAQVGVRGMFLALSGGRLYASSGIGLSVIDVANPSSPVLRGTDPSLVGIGVDAVGSRVYMAFAGLPDPENDFGGLLVIDAADPSSPELAGLAYGLSLNGGIATDGSLALVSAGRILKVVDVSDPLDPVVVGSFDNGEVRGLSCNVKDVAISGQYGYMLVGVPGNPASVDLAVVDLRAPSSPSIRGRVAVPGNLGYAIDVLAGRAFVAANASGLQVFDVTNSSAPRWIGAVDTPGNAVSVTVEGDYAYVGEFEAVHVIDVRNPANPFRRAQVGVRGMSLALSGGRLYASSGIGLSVIDVANPSSPFLLSNTPSLSGYGIEIIGSRLYMSDSLDGRSVARMIDVSDPAQPAPLGEIALPGESTAVAADGDLVFFQDTAATVNVIDTAP